ncbi:hypothetical protein DID77_01820 [Candidatus Marinamargulisbacteria bacterium SCGC AG-439-L15]|nr:hypothetical protein DID77_01820 [Candidatus Marinamargulisbacteria bacterium SCGC AG-439-L15]
MTYKIISVQPPFNSQSDLLACFNASDFKGLEFDGMFFFSLTAVLDHVQKHPKLQGKLYSIQASSQGSFDSSLSQTHQPPDSDLQTKDLSVRFPPNSDPSRKESTVDSLPFEIKFLKGHSICVSKLCPELKTALEIEVDEITLAFTEVPTGAKQKKGRSKQKKTKSNWGKQSFFGNKALTLFSKMCPFLDPKDPAHSELVAHSVTCIITLFGSGSHVRCDLIEALFSNLQEFFFDVPEISKLKALIVSFREKNSKKAQPPASLTNESPKASSLSKGTAPTLVTEGNKAAPLPPSTCSVWDKDTGGFRSLSPDSVSFKENPNTLEFYFWNSVYKPKVARGKYFDFCQLVIPSFYNEEGRLISQSKPFLEILVKEIDILHMILSDTLLHKRLYALPFKVFPDSLKNTAYVYTRRLYAAEKEDKQVALEKKIQDENKRSDLIMAIEELELALADSAMKYSLSIFLTFSLDFRKPKCLEVPENFYALFFEDFLSCQLAHSQLSDNKQLFSRKEFDQRSCFLKVKIMSYIADFVSLTWSDLSRLPDQKSQLNSYLKQFNLSLDADFLDRLTQFQFENDPSESDTCLVVGNFNSFIESYSDPFFLPLKAVLIEPFLPLLSKDQLLSLKGSFFNPIFEILSQKTHHLSLATKSIYYRVCQLYFWGTIFPDLLSNGFSDPDFASFQDALLCFLKHLRRYDGIVRTSLYSELSFGYTLFEALSTFDNSKLALSLEETSLLIPNTALQHLLVCSLATQSYASIASQMTESLNIFESKIQVAASEKRLLNHMADKLITVQFLLSSNYREIERLETLIIDHPSFLKDSRLRFALMRLLFVILIHFSSKVSDKELQKNKDTLKFLLHTYKSHDPFHSNTKCNESLVQLEKKITS